MAFQTKEWANAQLKFAISELRDAFEKKSPFHWRNTMQTVLFIKERLIEHRFFWQAKVIEYWIHKYQKLGAPKE
jgi:hypothetical protein